MRQRNNGGGGETGTDGQVLPTGKVKMKQNVGLLSGTSFIVGSIIGSGIFISPKGVIKGTGSVGLSLIIWGSSGLLSLFGALSYAELGTLIPKSGAEYVYIYEAYIPMLAFLYAWTRTLVIQPSAVAVICMVFASYFGTFFEYCGSPQPPEKITAVVVIIALCMINCYDTKWASNVQVFFTASKLVAVAIIIVGGFVRLGQGHLSGMQEGFHGTLNNPSEIALSFYDAMWAYDGWNTLNYLTEELEHPYRDLPRANVIGVVLVTIVYILTNISYITVLSLNGILESDAVAVDWGKSVLGEKAYIIMPIAVLFSTFGAANGFCFSSGRLVYSAAREGHLPEVLSYVHVKRYTPVPSIILTCFIAVLMVIPADISSMIDFFSFASWIFYGLAVSCLIVFRFKRPHDERPIKVFILIPIIFVLCAVYLVIGPIIDNPQVELLYAGMFILGGLLFYFPFAVFKLDRGCFDKVTTFIQLLLEVAPSPYEPTD